MDPCQRLDDSAAAETTHKDIRTQETDFNLEYRTKKQ